jgi:DHHC palmitoyltransferase
MNETKEEDSDDSIERNLSHSPMKKTAS